MDILIQNGRVIDPARSIDRTMDVAVSNGVIVDIETMNGKQPNTVDASGCLVLPGLIDYHTHINFRHHPYSANPDYMIATGVTAAVDAGSAGWSNYRNFHDDIHLRSNVKTKAFLCYADFGVDCPPERYEPSATHPAEVGKVYEKYGESLVGLKIRVSESIMKSIDAMAAIMPFAEQLRARVCVHTTDPVAPMGEVAALLRRGDVFCHAFHGSGNTILESGNAIAPAILEARNRGVLFDTANGRSNFSFAVARRCLELGFLPDIVSSDTTLDKMFLSSHSKTLPHVMATMLELGMPLPELIRAVTAAPARAMGMEGKIGTLAPGSRADIAILQLIDCAEMHHDAAGDSLRVNKAFCSQMTIIDGLIAHCRQEFNTTR